MSKKEAQELEWEDLQLAASLYGDKSSTLWLLDAEASS